ncbi:MAG: non-ribosomal peptide synthetase, partial [Polyangiaceae bacterium]|nr:non-ribosomal peptide synthetase [Polyangiaceae bacterium]
LRQSELRRVCDRFPSIRFVNGYGLTECTIESSVYDLREVPLDPRSGIAPLGKPFPGTDFLVLDDTLSMLPRGAIGELYIGGPGVSLGYIGDPTLTGQRFLDTESYGRIYRTGDLARHHGTDVFELVGRADHVLKIRGHRVDPGEVENAILALNGVRDVAVVPSTYRDQTSLIACVVLESYASIQDFSSELREKLPESMIPSRWVEFEELPRNTNGKVLRSSLVQWVTAQAEAVAAASKVSSNEQWTPREKFVASLWEEILGHPVADLDANFMGMGGNSVAILKVHNRLGEAGHDVAIGSLFSAYTVRRLSSLLDEATKDKS